jgi:hypothetical protein
MTGRSGAGKTVRPRSAASLAPDPPDEERERGDREHRHAAEERERLEQDRVAFEVHFDGERLALRARRERLFPRDDVAAFDGAARRVVEGHAARQVQAHGHQFVALPADISRVLAGGGRHVLREHEHAVLLDEAVGRPGERRALRQRADVVGLDAQVHVAPAFAPRGAHRRHARAGPLEPGPYVVAVEPRRRVDGQRRVAQGDERRHGRIHVDGGRPVEVEVDVLLVLVLPRDDVAAGRTGERRREHHQPYQTEPGQPRARPGLTRDHQSSPSAS